jgi:hypothetical protein
VIVEIIGFVLTVVLMLLLLGLFLAPLESLGWYAGWFGEADASTRKPIVPNTPSKTLRVGAKPKTPNRHYLVYLSGVGAISNESIPDEEYPFLEQLEKCLPHTLLVADVFPYSAMNQGLTGQRTAARIWKHIEQLRLKDPNSKLAMLINFRNIFQVAVSADPRYGPIANLGVARAIRDGLVAAGYEPGSGVPVTLLGSSGGGQMSLGAAYYLRPLLRAPIFIISLGGVMGNDKGIERVEHLWHLYGTEDPVQDVGAKVFPGRWPLFKNSAWNRALAAGRITMISLGPFHHNMKMHYYDNEARLPSGETYVEHSVNTICRVLREARLDRPVNPVSEEDS